MKPTVLQAKGTRRDLLKLAWVEQQLEQKRTAAFYLG